MLSASCASISRRVSRISDEIGRRRHPPRTEDRFAGLVEAGFT
jgi:hypothetical protein